MKILEYPFSGEKIVEQKRRIKKELLQETNTRLKKKIAILGGSTTNDVKQVLELFLLNMGIEPEFYESEYNQYYEDAMFDNNSLMKFRPDIIYIHTTNRNISGFPEPGDTQETIDAMIDMEMSKFTEMWNRLAQVYECPIIQNNFEFPDYRLMGNRDAYDIHGRINYINRLNMSFCEYAQNHNNFYIQDIQYISSLYGLDKWSDPFYWHMYKYAVSVPAIPTLAFNLANIIKSIYGKNKKALVLDLDNTLWGGVIGDDDVDNIIIGQEVSAGQAFSEFQGYLKDLSKIGVLLNIDSKNDEENAIAGLNHRDCTLHPKDFTVIKANWNPKSRNFVEIAEELNILPDSMVFVDDNPAEREIVRAEVLGASVPDIGQPENYIRAIDRSGFFEVTSFSADDLSRNEMYKENIKRAHFQTKFRDYKDYLKSLDMHAVIKPFEPVYLGRIAQLTNKSNQFNLTTKRFNQAEIEQMAQSDEYITLYGKLSDKFGDNGVVSIVIGKIQGQTLHIVLWLMSCRVLKRDMEYAMMDTLVQKAESKGIHEIKGYYYPTAKNKMVQDFYGDQNFICESKDEKGNAIWSYDIDDSYKYKNQVIEVIA
jgi:HAD-superfamily phosphatase, subfamily IIIC/FkbH-like domain